MSLQQDTIQLVKRVAVAVHENGLIVDNGAPSIAAAIIYMVIERKKLPYTKEHVKKASQMSEVTIGKCHKKLLVFKSILNPMIDS